MFLPSKSTLRKTAIGFAAAAMIGVSSFAPAGAQSTYGLTSKQSTPVSLRDCSKERDAGQKAICESANRTELAKARGVAADNLKACLLELQAFKAKSPEGFDKLGPISRETACAAAARIPKPTAGAPKPSG